MKKYIHIGFPKNFSTSLQRAFFSKHPSLLHLGVGVNSNIDYISDEINIFIENYLKYSKEYKYIENKERIITGFDYWFKKSELEKKIVGISSELFSFPETPDALCPTIVAKRLNDIFGNDTKIIMIIRNQSDLIKSMYRESVRIGYYGSYSDYIDYLYDFQERNQLYSFMYHNVYQTYLEYFGSKNIGLFFFENYRDSKNKKLKTNKEGYISIISDLSDFLDIENINLEFEHYNEAFPDSMLLNKIELNKIHRYDLGNNILEGNENHRNVKYLKNDLKLDYKEEFFFRNVIVKRMSNQLAKAMPAKSNKIEYIANNKKVKYIEEKFEESNKLLEMISGQKLPNEYLKIKLTNE